MKLQVTFGMPRVGERDFTIAFQRAMSGRSIRVVHFRDVVPHYPLTLFGYTHVCNEWWNATNNNQSPLKICGCVGSVGEDPSCADSVPPYDWHPKDHMTYLGVFNGGGCQEEKHLHRTMN
jgi:hypothetical protein